MKKLSIAQNAMYNTIGSCFYLACQWLVTVMVIRLGSIENGGVLSLAMSVTGMFYTLGAIGRAYQVSDYNRKYTTGEYVSTRLVTCGAALLLCAGYCALNRGLSGHEVICIIAYMAFRTVEGLSDEYQAIQQISERMDYICWSFVMRGILLLASFSLVIAFTKNEFWAISAMTVSTGLVVLLYDIPRCRQLDSYRIRLQIRKSLRLVADNIPLVMNSILLVCCVSIPRTTLNTIYGNYTMGIYSSIASPAAIIQNVAAWLFMPFVTRLTEKYKLKEKKDFSATHYRILLLLGGFIAAALIGAKILGQWALGLIYGEEVASYAALLIPTLLTTALIALEYYISMLLAIARFLKPMVIGNAAALILMFAFQWPLIQQHGAYGVNEVILISLGENLVIQYGAFMIHTRKWFREPAAAEKTETKDGENV